MAKKIIDLINFNPATTSFPDGSLKNQTYLDTEESDIDEPGSRIYGPYVQDILNVFHRSGRQLGKFLSGADDTQIVSQFFDWIAAAMMHKGSNFYTATSTVANTYELARDEGPIAYIKGLSARFVVPATNTLEAVTVNLSGIGARALSNGFVGIAESPSVVTGALVQGDVVDVMFDISEDGTQYFRVIGTPLNQLTEGAAFIQKIDGSTANTLTADVEELSYVTSNATDTYTTTISSLLMSVKHVVFASALQFKAELNTLNGWADVSRSGGGQQYLNVRTKPQGINFRGGPHSSSTEDSELRFVSIPIAVDEIDFVPDSTEYPGQPGRNWRAYQRGSTTELYLLNSGLPVGAEIFLVTARYTTPGSAYKLRNAPVMVMDEDPDDPTNIWSFTILSGDAQNIYAKPNGNYAGSIVELQVWYNGASL